MKTYLMEAARFGSTEVVGLLLNKGADPKPSINPTGLALDKKELKDENIMQAKPKRYVPCSNSKRRNHGIL